MATRKTTTRLLDQLKHLKNSRDRLITGLATIKATIKKDVLNEVYLTGEFQSIKLKKKGLALRQHVIKLCQEYGVIWRILPLNGMQLKKILRLDGRALLVAVAKDLAPKIVSIKAVMLPLEKPPPFPSYYTRKMKQTARKRVRRHWKRSMRRHEINQAWKNGEEIKTRFKRPICNNCKKCGEKLVPAPMVECDKCQSRFHKRCHAVDETGGQTICHECTERMDLLDVLGHKSLIEAKDVSVADEENDGSEVEVDSGGNDDDGGGEVGNFVFEVRRNWLEPNEDFAELEYQFEGEEEYVMGYVNDEEDGMKSGKPEKGDGANKEEEDDDEEGDDDDEDDEDDEDVEDDEDDEDDQDDEEDEDFVIDEDEDDDDEDDE